MSSSIHEGQLMKKGKINTAWKHRWCKLLIANGDIRLEYYDSKMNANLCGTIHISQVFEIEVIHYQDYDLAMLGHIPDTCVITDKIKCQQKYAFSLTTLQRKFICAAFDPKSFFEWIYTLNQLVYGGIIKEGWLHKRGEKNKQWKRRWFVLNQYQQLKYYQDEYKKSYAGAIQLNQVTSIRFGVILQTKQKKYTFSLNTNKRVWILCSHLLKERKRWVEQIEKWRKHPINIDNSVDKQIKQLFLPCDEEKEEEISISYESKISDHDSLDVEQYQCNACNKVYATKWPKCPGCFRKNTHFMKLPP